MANDHSKTDSNLFEVGFIYPMVNSIVSILKWFNISEWCKALASCVGKSLCKDERPEAIKRYKNFGVDVYQIAKWGLLIWLICSGTYNSVWNWVIVYLLGSNLFSYFYHHAWQGGSSGMTVNRQRRRFVTLLSAIAYFILCYAYLYQHGYRTEITWPNGNVDFVNSLYLSIATAFTFDGFEATSKNVRMVFASELVTTFFFFSIMLSESIPQRVR